MQGNAGQPGLCKWQSLDGEKCNNDSLPMTQSGIHSACESASVARGMPQEYGAIRNRKARRERKDDSKHAAECLR